VIASSAGASVCPSVSEEYFRVIIQDHAGLSGEVSRIFFRFRFGGGAAEATRG